MKDTHNDTPTLEYHEISFSYSRKVPLFTSLNLVVDAFPAALLGPNGAGKSTLLKLAYTALKPHFGSVHFGENNTGSRHDQRALAATAGLLSQEVAPIAGLRVREQVAYAGWLNGMRRRDAWAASDEALDRVGLVEFGEWRSSSLSGGQRRRMGIAQAVVHSPKLLLLDEPYAGLDPEQRAILREALQVLASTMSIVVSTHQTEDLEQSYKSVVVLNKGQVISSSSALDFLSKAGDGVPSHVAAEMAYRNLLNSTLVPTAP
jgi:ABC-2 type transport system ATP-binding protein